MGLDEPKIGVKTGSIEPSTRKGGVVMKKTVRDFKNFLLEKAGVKSGGEFAQCSELHQAFLDHLNQLGARNMRSQPPETVPDIDATVELTDEEWMKLEARLQRLL